MWLRKTLTCTHCPDPVDRRIKNRMNQDGRDHSSLTTLIQKVTSKHTFTPENARFWLSDVNPKRKYIWRLWNWPQRDTLTSVLVISTSNFSLLIYTGAKKKLKLKWEPEARLHCPSSPYTLNFVPQSSLFHLPFQPFIKICLHRSPPSSPCLHLYPLFISTPGALISSWTEA